MNIYDMAKMAHAACVVLGASKEHVRNGALQNIAIALRSNSERILAANKIDMEKCEQDGGKAPLLARLKFDEKKLEGAIEGVLSLIKIDDPLNKVQLERTLDDNLTLQRISCPIGVIGVIFEARPDALIQISSLCLKSGNAVILKGGSEAKNTNAVLFDIINKATKDLPKGWINLVETRDDVALMLKMDDCIDLLIPRGSNEFVKYIMNNSTIPVMGHADGICHMYIDKRADLEMAVNLCIDSKTQYVSACNALETLLVHKDIAPKLLPLLKNALDKKKVVIRGDKGTCEIIDVEVATDVDWETEYLDYILSIKLVDNVEMAIEHINTYGSRHTDCIVSENDANVELFMSLVDSANVYHNASTRFADGFRYGFGAEVGISTSKIHARGPVGLEGLMIYKYRLYGKGQTVAPYANGEKKFKHTDVVRDIPKGKS